MNFGVYLIDTGTRKSLHPLRAFLYFAFVLVSSLNATGESFIDTNRVSQFSITIKPSDWTTLRYQHRENEFFPTAEGTSILTNSYSWFPAELTLDGKKYSHVLVRKKGYIGSNDPKRPGLKIKFPTSVFRRKDGEEFELTLNNNNQDRSLVRQSLAYELFRRAEVPAPRCAFATIRVNGTDLGIYTLLEPIKGSFLRREFGTDSGNLYEGGRSDFRPGWFQNFTIKSGPSSSSRKDLEKFSAALAATNEPVVQVANQYVDLEEFLRFWASESLINHFDGYAGNVNNFYVYHRPDIDKFAFIPWGVDNVFVDGGINRSRKDPKSVIGVGYLANRLYNSPDGRIRYQATMRKLLQQAWNEDVLLKEVARLEQLLTPYLTDKPDHFRANLESVRTFVQNRRSEIEAELVGPGPELHSKPLELAKRRKVGELKAKFSAQWQIDAGTSAGLNDSSGSLSGRVYEDEIKEATVSVQVGDLPDMSDNRRPGFVLQMTSSQERKRNYTIFLSVDEDSYSSGLIPIDNTHIEGVLIATNSKGEESKFVGLLKGTLTLKKAGHKTGEAVEGDLNAEIFSKLPRL